MRNRNAQQRPGRFQALAFPQTLQAVPLQGGRQRPRRRCLVPPRPEAESSSRCWLLPTESLACAAAQRRLARVVPTRPLEKSPGQRHQGNHRQGQSREILLPRLRSLNPRHPQPEPGHPQATASSASVLQIVGRSPHRPRWREAHSQQSGPPPAPGSWTHCW